MEVSGRRENRSDVTSTCLSCDPCTSTGETHTATHFCTDCNEYLCGSCVNAHRKVRLTKDHRLLGQDAMPTRKSSSNTEICCRKHEGKPFDYFCKAHNAICCTACVTLDHRTCDVEYITDLMDRFETSREYGALRQKMVDLDRLIQESKSKADRNITMVKENSDKVVEQIRKFRTEINTVLDSLENEILGKVKEIKNKDLQSMADLTSELNAMKKDLDETTEQMDRYSVSKQKKHLVITSKQAETKVGAAERKIKDLSTMNVSRPMHFCPNEFLQNSIKSLTNLGLLEEENEKNVERAKSRGIVNRNTGLNGKQRKLKAKLIHQSDINVKETTDKTICWITGGVMIDSTQLALADGNNYYVKIVDTKKACVVSHLKLESYPHDITRTDNNQLVVTAPDIGSLIFLDIGKTLTVNKSLEVGKECHGIDNMNSMLVVTFTEYPESVKLLTMDGCVIKSASCDLTGNRPFTIPKYVVCFHDKHHIYVSDWARSTITKLNVNGDVVGVYSSEDLESPRGMAADRNGNIYIVGDVSNNICILRPDSGQIQPVLQVEAPQAIIKCKDSDQMIVSNVSDRRNFISVYNLT